MMALLGILGGAALFALFAFAATRSGTRLEEGHGCGGEAPSPEACSLAEECEACGHADSSSGWWPDDGVKDGDRR